MKGLSLADRLNVALFVLTIMGVILAAWSLRVAQKTLDDAKDSGRHQQEQFNQQSDQAQKQFQLQTEQSKAQFDKQQKQSQHQFEQQTLLLNQQIRSSRESLAALTGARSELEREAALLNTLQDTADSQLVALNRQTKTLSDLNDVRPLPLLEIECNKTVVFRRDAREDGIRTKAKGQEQSIPVLYPTETEGTIYRVHCSSHLSAEGRVPLTGATVEIIAIGDARAVLWPRVSGSAGPKVRLITPVSKETISPSVGAGAQNDSFMLFWPISWTDVKLSIYFSSDNGGNYHEDITIGVKAPDAGSR
jgi:hypothetical protein